MPKNQFSKYKKAIVFITSMVLLYFIYEHFLKDFSAVRIRDYVDSYGALAPIVYILLFAILPIAFFPVPVLALAGGLSFGLIEGSIYTIIGAMLNSTIMFFMARFIARDAINHYLRRKLPEKWIKNLEMSTDRRGFFMVLIMRLIPLIPYNMINYVSGLTEMNFASYSLATFIGIIPGTLVFLNIGDKAIDYRSKEFIISIVFLVLLIGISSYFARRINLDNTEKSELGEVEND